MVMLLRRIKSAHLIQLFDCLDAAAWLDLNHAAHEVAATVITFAYRFAALNAI